jgi:hypothetical protein
MAGELRAAGPLAVTVGLWRPDVVVTPELRALLTPDQLQVVVEHEEPHARRRDSLWTTFAAVVSVAQLPQIRRAVLRDLALALQETNENTSARFYLEGGQYLIHGIGRVRRPEDIGETIVAMRGAQPVLVRHLGEVRLGPALKLGEGSHDGKPAVVLGIQKQPGANTLELTRRLDAALDDIQATLPKGMEIDRNRCAAACSARLAKRAFRLTLRDALLAVRVERVVDDPLRSVDLVVVAQTEVAKAFGHGLETPALGLVPERVVGVGAVHDLREQGERRVLLQQLILPTERVERAVLAAVAELGARGVVRRRALSLRGRGHLLRRHEQKLRVAVDELPDEPRAGDAVHLHSGTCDPLHGVFLAAGTEPGRFDVTVESYSFSATQMSLERDGEPRRVRVRAQHHARSSCRVEP